ncbi:MAG: MMPL family transporter [Deltaproteobacteria bacterium]|nr:MMPL family transporter [Deltaproteobacteria bacterium]
MKIRGNDILRRWVDLSISHPWRIIGIATLIFWASVLSAMQLDLKSNFVELLPTDSPAVKNLEHMKKRVASFRTLTVTVEASDLDASMKFADDLVKRLRRFPKDQIRYIDYNLKELTDFYERNKWLYASLQDLEDFRDRLKKRIHEETQASVIESLDEEEPQKTDLRLDELKRKYEKKTKEQERYPKGYYVTPDRTLLAIFLRPPSTISSYEASSELVNAVKAEVRTLNPSRYAPDMKIGYTGEVETGIEERDALASDMRFIGVLALVLILGVIVVYYRSLRSVLLIGMPMLLGLAVAFAVAYWSIGYLNSATAFLTSIVAGNGINFMIMMAARFYEEVRERGPDSLDTSLHIAVSGSFRGTLVAAAAASIAYGSLVFAGFRGFRQFGIIGGVGMMACWLSSFAVGPALITVIHRFRPLGTRKIGKRHPISTAAGDLVVRHSRWILLSALVLSAASVLPIIPYSFDPFEYDFHKLRNREGAERGSARLSHRVDTMFDLPPSPTPILANSLDEVPRIEKTIREARDSRYLIGDVKTLLNFLPKSQKEKLEVLGEIRDLVDRKLDFLDAKDRKTVLEYRPPDDLRALTVDDAPEVVARPFTEVDGTRGRIIYAYSKPGESLLDGRYLLKFSAFLRGLRVDGKPLLAVGQAMVFADMLAAIVHDGVVVSVAAMVGVLLLLIVAFRRPRAILIVLSSVGLGSLWMLGAAALFDMKLNFLNFVVIPITLGIGVDYGANIYARYRQEGAGRIRDVIQSTGGAVVATSMTTIIGYATLITSTNMALQSFGILADIGEFTCLAAAELVMTALIVRTSATHN